MTENKKTVGLSGVLSGVEKLAILMNVLGRDKCVEIMKEMKDIDVRRLLKVMNSMKKAPIGMINQVLSEYLYKISETEEIIFDERSFSKCSIFYHIPKSKQYK